MQDENVFYVFYQERPVLRYKEIIIRILSFFKIVSVFPVHLPLISGLLFDLTLFLSYLLRLGRWWQHAVPKRG